MRRLVLFLTLLVCLAIDRKSTRLNSSHLVISYAVFCLKKKKNIEYYVIQHDKENLSDQKRIEHNRFVPQPVQNNFHKLHSLPSHHIPTTQSRTVHDSAF